MDKKTLISGIEVGESAALRKFGRPLILQSLEKIYRIFLEN